MEAGDSLPEGTKGFINRLIKDSVKVFQLAEEPELKDWAERVHSDFNSEAVQRLLRVALEGWLHEIGDGPHVGAGLAAGEPIAYSQLLHEFKALFSRRPRVHVSASDSSEYDGLDHSFDLGEIALDSLKDAVEKYPHAKAIISVIKELVQMAKAISQRLKAGW